MKRYLNTIQKYEKQIFEHEKEIKIGKKLKGN